MERVKDKKGITTQIKICWCIEDVMEKAKKNGKKLTRKEAGDVLDYMLHKHDCNLGITWETIDYWIDEVISERD